MTSQRSDPWWFVPDGHPKEDTPDPWAEQADEHIELSPDQREFLAALDDQPPVPRLRELQGRGERPGPVVRTTGNPPEDESPTVS